VIAGVRTYRLEPEGAVEFPLVSVTSEEGEMRRVSLLVALTLVLLTGSFVVTRGHRGRIGRTGSRSLRLRTSLADKRLDPGWVGDLRAAPG
jgi:hypothetical protein